MTYYASLFAMKLSEKEKKVLLNDKIIASCPTNMFPKHNIKITILTSTRLAFAIWMIPTCSLSSDYNFYSSLV